MELQIDGVGHVAVSGTPGTGKSTICKMAIEKLDSSQFEYVNVGELCTQQGLLSNRDEQRDSWVVDEDAMVDAIEELIRQKPDIHFLLDYHGCEFWPEKWIAGVFVVRTDNTILFERLEARQYAQSKIEENVQCEIFGSLLEEAMEAYNPKIVFQLQNDTQNELKKNVDTLVEYMRKLL